MKLNVVFYTDYKFPFELFLIVRLMAEVEKLIRNQKTIECLLLSLMVE